MPKKKRGEELMVRTARLSSACANVSIAAHKPQGEPARIGEHHWLTFRGVLDEPVKNAREIEFTLEGKEHPEPGPAKPASVGAIVQVRPHITVFVRVPAVAFDRLWTRADLIKHAHFVSTKPRYGSALVTSVMPRWTAENRHLLDRQKRQFLAAVETA